MAAPADLRAQLQQNLSGSFTLERELGGGGMSRVFVATEQSLGRKVVIKVLPPELAQGVSVERFKREIQLAAQLQHPHIVGVLSAGESSGIPYYTMPLVDGHSLRERLVKSGALSVTETIGILRDVAKALAYAHDHGIVHRDIKPDNVLLTGGSAVVSDFGIAKAIAAARTGPTGQTLTQIGSSLGTPAYMAPEQAAADPNTNYRADIYSFGVMAYEMLAGRPPFHGRTPQKLLAAHMGESPQPIAEVRPETPPLLAELVMSCLAKDADARPQSAADLIKVLETVTSGGTHPAMPEILLGGRPRLWRALGLWAAAFVMVTITARAAVIAIGLPDWVFPAAIVVMALGVPVILFTYFVHRGAHQALTSATLTPGGTQTRHGTFTRLAVKASRHVSWRRTTLGGAYALGTLVIVVAGYMLLRALGIGPIGSLLAKGAIDKNERILVADFRHTGGDTMLGPIVTEAFRTALGQSRSVVVMPSTRIRDVLKRMQRDPKTVVDASVAREIATREGIKGFVEGDVLSVGGKYLFSARLTEAQTGQVLASLQETADSDADILGAIDRLSRKLRERIGESLRAIRDARPLEQVSTPSLEALRKYVQGVDAIDYEGDFDRGRGLLEEAIAIDSGFAMAYRKLSAEFFNRRMTTLQMNAISQAYAHRDRLTDAERYLTIADYYSQGPHQDSKRAISAYESLLDIQPTNSTAMNNAGVAYGFTRDFRKAMEMYKRVALEKDAPVVAYTNVAYTAVPLADTATALSALSQFAAKFPSVAAVSVVPPAVLYALGRRDSAVKLLRGLEGRRGLEADTRARTQQMLATIALRDGRAREASRAIALAMEADRERGMPTWRLDAALEGVMIDAWIRDQPRVAREKLHRALRENPIARFPHVERPYVQAVSLLTMVGDIAGAKAILALFDRDTVTTTRLVDPLVRHRMRGDIALAEGRYRDAVGEYRDADVVTPCNTCLLPSIARAYDLAGDADSAIAVYTRFTETPSAAQLQARSGVGTDGEYLPLVHKRLGELWEEKGDPQRALGYYLRFVDLWKNADPDLQPRVAEVRRRIDRLKVLEGK